MKSTAPYPVLLIVVALLLSGCGGKRLDAPVTTGPATWGGIEGRVLDRGGDPVVGATVSLLETGAKNTTDVRGMFHFNDLRDGTYTVVANDSHHVEQRQTIDVALGGVSSVTIVMMGLDAVDARPPGSAPGIQSFAWETDQKVSTLVIELAFRNYTYEQGCELLLAYVGIPPKDSGIMDFNVIRREGAYQAWTVQEAGRSLEAESNGVSTRQIKSTLDPVNGVIASVSPSGHSIRYDYTPETFKEYKLRGNFTMLLGGTNLQPNPVMQDGAKSVRFHLSCLEPVDLTYRLSQSAMLFDPWTVQGGTQIDMFGVYNTRQGTTQHAMIKGQSVEWMVGPAHGQTQDTTGQLQIVGPDRSATWNFTTPGALDLFTVETKPGDQKILLDRTSVARSSCATNCVGPDPFFGWAIGWDAWTPLAASTMLNIAPAP